MVGVSNQGTAGSGDEPLRVFFFDGVARVTIWASVAIAMALILLGFVLGDPILMLSSLMPIAVSGYHLPMRQNNRAQIVVSSDGIFVDGLGLMPWEEIHEAELWEPEPGATLDPDERRKGIELIVETRHAIEFTIEPQSDLTLMRTFQVMVWRLEELNVVRIRLQPLNVDPNFLGRDVRRRLRLARNWAP